MLAAASAVGNCLGCSVLDNRSWPGIWAGAALVNASVRSSVLAAVTIGTGNTLEALTGALLIRRFSGVPYRFERGEDAVKFFAVVAPSAAVAATIGVSGLAFAGAAPVGVRTRATRALRKERDSLESKVQESTRELQSANRSLMEDLVARMRLQEQLSDRDQRLRLLIDGIQDDSVMILDHDGKVVSRSAGSARIIGYRSEEIVGRNHACFYTAEAIERKLPEKHLQIARIDRRVEDQGWRVRKDATAFWANVIITTLSDVENKPKGFVSVARDMTERKRVEALEESERQTIEFLAMLGHELRNPLAPIGNALGLMKIRPTDQRTQEWSRSVIDRQVVHGRVDAVADRRARAFFGAQVRRRALLVDADLARLSQVLINLLNNAAKYTPGRRPSHGQPARRSWCESVTARSA